MTPREIQATCGFCRLLNRSPLSVISLVTLYLNCATLASNYIDDIQTA